MYDSVDQKEFRESCSDFFFKTSVDILAKAYLERLYLVCLFLVNLSSKPTISNAGLASIRTS